LAGAGAAGAGAAGAGAGAASSLAQPLKTRPAINIIINGIQNNLFTTGPPFWDLYICLSPIRFIFFICSTLPPFYHPVLHLDNGPDRAEIFFFCITGSAVGTFT
jgi:hypothetical protein